MCLCACAQAISTNTSTSSKETVQSPVHTPGHSSKLSSLQGFSSDPEGPSSPFSPQSLAFSPRSSSIDTEDATSVSSIASSASALEKHKFSIPDSWPPAIMACIQQPTIEEQRRAMGPLVRNEVVRVLATQMFCVDPKPQKEFCTQVAKKLVTKYSFMRDTGVKVSGYVSICVCSVCIHARTSNSL